MEELRLTSTIAHTYFGGRDARYNQHWQSPEPFTISAEDFAIIEALCQTYGPFSWKEKWNQGTENVRLEHELAWIFHELKKHYLLLDFEEDKRLRALSRSYSQHEGRKKGIDQFFNLLEICDPEKLRSIEFVRSGAGKGRKTTIESPELILFICDAIKHRYQTSKEPGSPYHVEMLHFDIERGELERGKENRTLVLGFIPDDRLKHCHHYTDFMREEVTFLNTKRKGKQADPIFAFGSKLFYEAGVPFDEGRGEAERPSKGYHNDLGRLFAKYCKIPLPDSNHYFWYENPK